MSIPEITVQELKERQDNGEDIFILDVRKPKEYDISNLNGKLIPLSELKDRLDELKEYKNEEIVVHCRTGGRSAKATAFLRQNGFDAKNLKGGINAWSDEIDSSVEKY